MMFVLVLGTTVAFTSCSNDDDNDDSNNEGSTILGTWCSSDSGYEIVDGIRYEWNSYGETTFLEDGTVIIYAKGYDPMEEYEYTEYASWKTDGNILYIGWAHSNKDDVEPIDINDTNTWEFKYKYSISGNRMTVTDLVNDEGNGTLTRK